MNKEYNKLETNWNELKKYLKEQINECKTVGNDEDYVKVDVYEEILNKILEILEEYKKLEDNWIELKEYIEKTKIKEFEKSYGKRYGRTFAQAEIVICNMIKEKIQELEKSDK